MTAHARTRRHLAERFADLLRGHRRLPAPPDLIPMRTVDYGDGPKIVGFWNERPAGPGLAYDTSYDHPGWDDEQAESMDPGSHDHPTWIGESARPPVSFAEDEPGSGPPWDLAVPAAYLNPGPGSLDDLWAAGRGHDLTVVDNPVTRIRPYAPEPEYDEPESEPVPVSYPPRRPLAADYRDLPMFRAVTRGACRAGLRGIGVRQAGRTPGLPNFRISEQWPGFYPAVEVTP
jgi:hypothetical protein